MIMGAAEHHDGARSQRTAGRWSILTPGAVQARNSGMRVSAMTAACRASQRGIIVTVKRLWFSLIAMLCFSLAATAEKKIEPARAATEYPAHVTQDGITIAVDPYDRMPKQNVFRVDYLQYDVIPLRIIVTNTTDKPISLSEARILLLPQDGGKINAAEPEDVERKVSSKARQGTNIPIGPITWHKQGKDADKKVEADFNDYEYSAVTVAPHTTQAGFLFYDAQGLGQHPLAGAHLVFRQVHDGAGREMFAFEVPMDAYLNAEAK